MTEQLQQLQRLRDLALRLAFDTAAAIERQDHDATARLRRARLHLGDAIDALASIAS